MVIVPASDFEYDPESGDISLLHVHEVAALLDTSLARVRRMCDAGELRAYKNGSYWVIDAGSVPGIERMPQPWEAWRTAGSDAAARSLDQIQLLDIKEEWIPDVLRHEDQLDARSELLRETLRLREERIYQRPHVVQVPKNPYFSRSGQILILPDRINFHAAVASLHDRIEATLSPNIFAARKAFPRSPYLLRKGLKQWQRWRSAVLRSIGQGNQTLIKSDISSYFDCIKHDILIRELRELCGPEVEINEIEEMLKMWSVVPGQGLPQGPDASRILANFYLAPVDRTMMNAGYRYFRYMDDIRITAKTRKEAVSGLQLFEQSCRERGLFVNASKTKLLRGRRAIKDDDDSLRVYINAIMPWEKHRPRARELLKAMFKQSLKRDGEVDARAARFSLWRLSILRDRGARKRLLRRLEDLGPLAERACDYLAPYIEEAETVQAFERHLRESRSSTPVLSYFLMATMLEHTDPMPNIWVDQCRSIMKDRNEPVRLRGVAASVVTRGGLVDDVEWLRREISTEADEYLLRAYAVALKRGSYLTEQNLVTLRGVSTYLRRTANYLADVSDLPSITRYEKYVAVRGND